MLDAYPADVCDVEQTVYAADVNECTEVCESLNNTLDNCALFEAFEQLLFFSSSLILENFLVRKDESLLTLVNVNDLNFQSLTCKCVEIFNVLEGQLRSGDECVVTFELGEYAALDRLGNLASINLVLVQFFYELLPLSLVFNLLAGKSYITFAIVESDNFCTDFITGLEELCECLIVIDSKVFFSDDTIRFIANVNANFVIRNLNYDAVNELSSPNFFECFFKFCEEIISFVFCSFFCCGFCCFNSFFNNCFSLFSCFSFNSCFSNCFFSHYFSFLNFFEFAHVCFYLPDYPIRCRCTGNNTYYIII